MKTSMPLYHGKTQAIADMLKRITPGCRVTIVSWHSRADVRRELYECGVPFEALARVDVVKPGLGEDANDST